MKYYSVPLKLVENGDNDYYAPDVAVAYLEHRHFDTGGMTCKVAVEDNVTVANGTLIDETTWRTP